MLRIAVLGCLIGGVAAGCSSDEKEGDSQATSGGVRGESCTSTRDCGSGLACVDGMCSVRTFGIPATQNECVAIECRSDEECLPVDCRTYKQECDAGITTSCTQYDLTCDQTDYGCQDDICVFRCTGDIDCPLGACVEGRCADCGSDDDCGTDQVCVDNQCVQGCEEKADCPIFHDCENEVCVEVGCASDRECIADTGRTRAVCQNRECVVPCETDIQCDEPSSFSFFACVENRCTALGCESDVECRIIMNVAAFDGDAECRPAAN